MPVITVGLLVMGTNGLKEAAYSAVNAEEPYYQSLTPSSKPLTEMYNEVRLKRPNNDLRPSFTFFVHGIGGHAANWSNDLNYFPDDTSANGFGLTGSDFSVTDFKWNEGSIVTKIHDLITETRKINADSDDEENDTSVFVAKYDSDNKFQYYRYDVPLEGRRRYVLNSAESHKLSNQDSHNIVVYETDNGFQNLETEFEHFEYVVNRLCYDYKQFYGFTPKINLIGHSRGGLVVQKYVNEYPYNVQNYFNIATPYNGTESMVLAETLQSEYGSMINLESFTGGISFDFTKPAYADLKNQSLLNEIKTTWNDLKTNPNKPYLELEGYDYGGVMTLPYVKYLITSACEKAGISTNTGIVSTFLDLFDQINNLCIQSNSGNTYSTTNLIKYEDYMSACQGRLSETTKKTMRDMIYSALYDFAYNEYAIPQIGNWRYVPILRHIAFAKANDQIKAQLSAFKNVIIPLLVDSITSFNGQVGVFNNDLLVDLNSQMAEGYWGQNRYVKIFGLDYLQSGVLRPTDNNFLVGHNLETMNEEIADSVMYHGVFPKFAELHYHATSSDVKEYKYRGDTIDSDVKEYIVDGNKITGSYAISYNPSIKIAERTEPLVIRFIDFRATIGASSAGVTEPLIKYTGTSEFDLDIQYKGENFFQYYSTYKRNSGDGNASVISCYTANIHFQPLQNDSSLELKGAKGATGDQGAAGAVGGVQNRNGLPGGNGGAGKLGKRGAHCIECLTIDLSQARNLMLRGGDGGDGGRGGDGGNGGNGKTKGNGYKGGDGGNGGTGGRGGNGMSGSYPFFCTMVTLGDTNLYDREVYFVPGKPGAGGRGGNGGNGGNGANGSSWFGTNHNGGNGGNGGIAGTGGNSGQSFFEWPNSYDIDCSSVINAFKSTFNSSLCGQGGRSGNFGNGGNAGRRSGLSSQTAPIVSGDGTPGKAVQSRNQLNGIITDVSDLVASNGFIYNGWGIDVYGIRNRASTQPSYGKNGSVVYNYNA